MRPQLAYLRRAVRDSRSMLAEYRVIEMGHRPCLQQGDHTNPVEYFADPDELPRPREPRRRSARTSRHARRAAPQVDLTREPVRIWKMILQSASSTWLGGTGRHDERRRSDLICSPSVSGSPPGLIRPIRGCRSRACLARSKGDHGGPRPADHALSPRWSRRYRHRGLAG